MMENIMIIIFVLGIFAILMPIYVCCINSKVKRLNYQIEQLTDVNIKILMELKELNKKIDKKGK